MPIRHGRMHLYPGGSIKSPEWQEIRERIGERSGWKCEACGVPHKVRVCRGVINGRHIYMLEDGNFFDEDTGEQLGRAKLHDMAQHRWVLIILTVAHFDQDETNNADENLLHWCQLHHNRHDVDQRKENAAATRRAKSPQMQLEFDQ